MRKTATTNICIAFFFFKSVTMTNVLLIPEKQIIFNTSWMECHDHVLGQPSFPQTHMGWCLKSHFSHSLHKEILENVNYDSEENHAHLTTAEGHGVYTPCTRWIVHLSKGGSSVGSFQWPQSTEWRRRTDKRASASFLTEAGQEVLFLL